MLTEFSTKGHSKLISFLMLHYRASSRVSSIIKPSWHSHGLLKLRSWMNWASNSVDKKPCGQNTPAQKKKLTNHVSLIVELSLLVSGLHMGNNIEQFFFPNRKILLIRHLWPQLAPWCLSWDCTVAFACKQATWKWHVRMIIPGELFYIPTEGVNWACDPKQNTRSGSWIWCSNQNCYKQFTPTTKMR